MVQLEGELVSWNEERGFGFIRPQAGGRDVFVHIRDLWPRSRLPQVGERIFYALELDREGRPRAVEASIGRPRTVAAPINRHRAPPPAPRAGVGLVRWLLATFPFVCSLLVGSQTWIPLGIYTIASTIGFGLYYFDKQKAQLGEWRTPEAMLHLCELLGGWPGALIAQGRFRHKTRKVSFQVVFWGIVLLHVAGWIGGLMMDAEQRASLLLPG